MKNTEKRKCDDFFDKIEKLGLALSYNDVRLKTGYSQILPANAKLQAKFSRNVGFLNIPIVSAPMDTVTEADMAIALAKIGGLGIIHKGLSPQNQASAVEKVKHNLSAFIYEPICINPNQTVAEVLAFIERKNYRFLSFPVLNNSGKLMGTVVKSNFEFCLDNSAKISDIMLKEIISAEAGTTVEQAYKIMMQKRVKILPILDKNKKFKGIYTLSDVRRIVKGHSPDYNISSDGTLKAGAAIGVGEDTRQRMELLAKAKVDVVVIDTAHGDSKAVIEAVKFCKKTYPKIDVVAGNVSEAESAKRLAEAGADGVKVGQGPGSICTTRIIAGVGCPQVTAVYNCAKALRGYGVPVCADGGIEYSGDITIALSAGADCVMLGKLLAGTTESPGEIIYRHDKKQVKVYRGMGSLGAMIDNKASRERYGQAESAENKLVPEGIESEVDYKGDVSFIIYQLLGGLRSGMGYCGAETISELQKKADFYRLTPSGVKESHPHGLEQIKKSPNY
ncbi:MAG: IMP dehydrogenase [Candidatus Staskawiczbacteria bacterium]|nr:IMP dehydrogenase [Candidatus Staskawiczbacteria bacterium]